MCWNLLWRKLPPLLTYTYRCKVVHKPAGIEALVPGPIVRERYSKISASYNRVRIALAGDANEYLPLYRLHDVLMIEIWDYLKVSDRHNIAAVSRRFRSIALNTSRLWRFIDYRASPPVRRIDILLKRAGVAPLHIRVDDRQLNAIRPLLPSPKASVLSWPLPPLPPQPPPHTFHPNLHSRPGISLHSRFLTPSRQPTVENILRAAVLDIVLSQNSPFSLNLGIKALPMVMPMLHSLRFSVATRPSYIRGASVPLTKSLLGVHTPLLRHLAVIQFDINWSDPVFRNLTYLLVRRPRAPATLSLLVQILRACPSLTYLGLEAAISPTSPNETFSSIELSALQRLYITDVDTQRITAALNCISAPNILECDLTSADWSWFDNQPTFRFSPLGHLRGTQDVTLKAPERDVYRWAIEYRWEAKRAVRLHFGMTASSPQRVKIQKDDTTKFMETLRRSPIMFSEVRSLTLRGTFAVATLTEIFGMFPEIKKLSTRGTYHPRIRDADKTVLDILSVQYCPQLRAIDIGAWPTLSPSNLLTWLSTRSAPGGGCCRLKKVVVASGQPLPSMMRPRIAAMLDKFLWRKNIVQYNALWNLGPFIPLPIPQQNEGAIWDDDDEEWARVPSPPLLNPQDIPSDVQDDPTIVYCDQALQGRWNYFAIP